ncbi:lipocalin family protein [Akkermansia sp.]|uniref:lipocalin family protein n=1 Tax=Akkermansia sp. TaxID=1872421 RepID=UPI003AB16978
MRLFLLLPALSLATASCSMQPTPSSLSGSWTQPVPGQPGHVQGMQLLPDGRARSINMRTLLYRSWQLDGKRLTLTGKSIGNGNSSLFTTTSTIDRFSRTTLILNTDGNREAYTRTPDAAGR